MPGRGNSRQTKAVNRLMETPGVDKSLGRADFTLSNGVAGERSEVASLKARTPLRVREGVAARLVLFTAERFTTDGTAGNTETFNLSHDAVDTDNATPFALYEGASRVSPDSVDYAANSFDYTDDGTANDLTAFYVPRDPGQVTVEKVAPSGQAALSETLHETDTRRLAVTNQNKEPVEFDFMGALEGVIPKNWRLKVYVDGPAAIEWNDDAETTTHDVAATAAALSMPVHRYRRTVPDLESAVKEAAMGLGGRR